MNTDLIKAEACKVPEMSEQILNTFLPMAEMLKEFESRFNEIIEQKKEGITEDLQQKAKRLRLDIRKVRTEADKLRKEKKQGYLDAANAIQSVYNILKIAVTSKEDVLTEIEKHYEKIEQQKKEDLANARFQEITKFQADFAFSMSLAEMTDYTYKLILEGAKEVYKNAEREKAEREKAEKEKREESARLKIELQEKEKERLAELAKIRKERDAKEKENQKEIEKIWRAKEAIQAKELAKIRKEEEEKRKKIIADQKAKEEEVKEALQRVEEAKAKAPDREKIRIYINEIDSMQLPNVSSKEAKILVDDIQGMIFRMINYINKELEKI